MTDQGTWGYPTTIISILIPDDDSHRLGDKVTLTDKRTGITHEWTVAGFWNDAGYVKLERKRGRVG
jgi:hypothetical protein